MLNELELKISALAEFCQTMQTAKNASPLDRSGLPSDNMALTLGETCPPASLGDQSRVRHVTQSWTIWQFRELVDTPPTVDSQDAEPLDDFISTTETVNYLSSCNVLNIILAVLFAQDPDHRPKIEEILGRQTVVFAILLSIDLGRHIRKFLGHQQFYDDKLPFISPHDFPQHTDSQSETLYEQFRKAQWRFCAVTLRQGQMGDIRDETPMPYIEQVYLGEGRSSRVYRVTVHPEYDHLEEQGKRVSVIKHRFSHSVADFSKERRVVFSGKHYALEMYRDRGCFGIDVAALEDFKKTEMMGQYCSYTHRQHHCILVEYADLGTLESYMADRRPPYRGQEIRQFWTALLRITRVIGSIHGLRTTSHQSLGSPVLSR